MNKNIIINNYFLIAMFELFKRDKDYNKDKDPKRDKDAFLDRDEIRNAIEILHEIKNRNQLEPDVVSVVVVVVVVVGFENKHILTVLVHVHSGSRLIGRLGSRHSVPFIRFSRLTDVNYTIRHEFVSITLSRLTEYPVYPSPD